MKITSATFLTSAPDLESCPEGTRPEFAFIGRSNVGKSSLLNMLCGKKGLAKVSGKPGHTRLLNFFEINERWLIVDLPGYGYAKKSKEDREKMETMILEYLANRGSLFRVFVLIDSRHPPQRLDLATVQWLTEQRLPFALVFTKTDKLSAGKATRNITEFHEAISEWCDETPETFRTSSEKGDGRSEILEFIDGSIH